MTRAVKCVSSSFPIIFSQQFLISRRRIGVIRVIKAKLSESNAQRANLSARKKERIRLPNYGDVDGGKRKSHISEFLNHPSGVDAILNARALQSVQSLDSNMYSCLSLINHQKYVPSESIFTPSRCILPQIQLLNFEVAPVLDLQVIPTTKDCVVEMLSCKFEGSELVERQNDHFSASMINHITWETIDSDSFLDVDVKVHLILEIYTHPFTLLPTSAVEGPGNLMMQALMDRLVPLHIQQLLQDYDNWVRRQRNTFNNKGPLIQM